MGIAAGAAFVPLEGLVALVVSGGAKELLVSGIRRREPAKPSCESLEASREATRSSREGEAVDMVNS